MIVRGFLVLFAAASALAFAAPGAKAAPTIAGCPLFPASHVLNARVDKLPVHPRSAAWIANLAGKGDGARRNLHMDFGSGLYPDLPARNAAPIGIPVAIVDSNQARVPVAIRWSDESDQGPYPIPPGVPIEGVGPGNRDGPGDRHVIVVDRTACKAYEVYNATPLDQGARWKADAGAIFDLRSNALRPEGWTSADGAGLSILHGLVRYDEVAAGSIEHALRFTAQRTRSQALWPARHHAGKTRSPDVPPMGARFRLKASVDLSRFTGEALVIARAMKAYGLVLADNGAAWFVTGVPDPRWDNTTLRQLSSLAGDDFEAVSTHLLMIDEESAEARPFR